MNETLKKLDACDEGLEWLGDKPLETAWAECHRGDWMLWVAGTVGVDIKTLTLAKVRCARLAQHLMTDQRSLDALDVAEAFAMGNATRAQLDAAYDYAAYDYAAYAYADADTADAADAYAYAYAAAAAYAAADADAYAAADAAYAAADADAYAAADTAAAVADARKKILYQCAEICRETIPLDVVLRLIKEQGE